MDADEVRKLARLEDRHWWYAERRHLLERMLARGGDRGRALDIGAAGGGNTRVLRDAGLRAFALEYGEQGAQVARQRGLTVVRADACALPFGTDELDVVVAFDVLEHIPDDARAVAEVRRVLRPGGRLLVMVPTSMALWSAHDEAVGHVRRYERDQLLSLLQSAGFRLERVRAWNVVLRPLVRWRRRSSSGSDLDRVPPLLNATLRGVVALERLLPVGRWRGVSLTVECSA